MEEIEEHVRKFVRCHLREALRAAHPFSALGLSRAEALAAGPGAGQKAVEARPLEKWKPFSERFCVSFFLRPVSTWWGF